MIQEGDLLWEPSPAWVRDTQLAAFTAFVEERLAIRFDDFEALWRWSVKDAPACWSALWDFFDSGP